MKCPACKRVLKKLKVGKLTLDACQSGCGGVWFDANELDEINAQRGGARTPAIEIERTVEVNAAEDRVLKCVRCRGVKLEQKLFSLGSGVIMDRCPKCDGLWLDYGELETIGEEINPVERPVRHVVERSAPKSVPITFGVIREIQRLRVSVS